jgi:predicted phosphodiesterase
VTDDDHAGADAAPTPEAGTDPGPATAGPLLARLSRPTSERRTRLVVLSDLHLTPTERGTWKVYHRTVERTRRAVDTANDLAPDATVLLGDLTRHGRPEEFAVADDLLGRLDAPLFSVPGNHDVAKHWDDYPVPSVPAFASSYADGRIPFYRRVGGVDLLGLDTASGDGDLYESHEGRITESQLDWLARTLPRTDTPVVALHHTLLHPRRHVGGFPDGDFYQTGNADALRSLLAAHGARLVLSGHLHWPATARADGVREVVAPAVCSFPQAGMVVDVGPGGTEIRLVPLAGPAGVAEAYSHARSGSAHGQGIATHADRGYLASFPLVDESAEPAEEFDGMARPEL